MAQPRDYTRQYNFNDYQTTNPSNPLPGSQVDGELDAVKLTLDDLNANIAKIQRDDGKLDNAAVHKDAFSQDALALINSDFTPRGDWSTATAYAVNDAVDFNGATYVATVAHTSSAAFSTDDAADRWILIANAAISGTGSAVDKFEGDGNTTSFTLTYTYTSETAVQVFVNGELLNPVDDYTISGNTLTLYTAPGLPSVAGNENVIVWGASVVAQAAAQDAQGHESNASGFADEAESWASQTSGIVESTDYSSKAYAIGGTGVDGGAGSAKDWATKTSGTVGNTTEYSSKYWATQGNVPIVAQNIAQINTVAGISSDVTTVANNDANVTTVAGIDGNVTTVAGISGDVTTVAGNNANVTTLAGLNTQITTLGAISSDISTVSSISANTTTVAGVSTDVTTVAGISGNVSTVAGISSNVTTVALANANVTAIATDITGTNTIGTTAGSIANVNIVANAITNVNSAAQNMSDINTVATEINNNNLQTVANDIQAVITTANDLNEATSEIDTVANSIANVDLVGGSISNVNTVAANLTDVNAFFDTYAIGATAPSSPTTGDLWFDTSTSTMKVYSGSGFINAGSSVNGTAARFVYTATAAQTTFTGADDGNNTLAYDAGYVDIYMNGVKLAPADYTASNGTSIVLASGAALNDVIEIVAYGTFTLANLSLNDLTDVSTTGVADGQFLTYNNANSQFEVDSSLKVDTNGSLLINKTTANYGATAGFEFRGDNDTLYLANDSDKAIALNRNTSDGEIISFRKDDATVGSIGTNSTGLTIGDGAAGVLFLDSSRILPWNVGTNTGNDANIDLGDSTRRFRTLYLSGVVYGSDTTGNPVGNHNPGYMLHPTNGAHFQRDGGNPVRIGRDASDGNVTEWFRQGVLVGSAAVSGDQLSIKSEGSNLNLWAGGSQQIRIDPYRIYPQLNDAYDLGYVSQRFKDVYATGRVLIEKGSGNVGVGNNSINSVSSGAQNTAVGINALNRTTTSSYNTAYGVNAGYYVTGEKNTFVGHDAGSASGFTGNRNTIIGRYNGNQAGLNIATSDGQIVLSDGNGDPMFHFDGNYWQQRSKPITNQRLTIQLNNGDNTEITVGHGVYIMQLRMVISGTGQALSTYATASWYHTSTNYMDVNLLGTDGAGLTADARTASAGSMKVRVYNNTGYSGHDIQVSFFKMHG